MVKSVRVNIFDVSARVGSKSSVGIVSPHMIPIEPITTVVKAVAPARASVLV